MAFKLSSCGRYFHNNLGDWHEKNFSNCLTADGKYINANCAQELSAGLDRLLEEIEAGFHKGTKSNDISIYTGWSGIAFLFWELGNRVLVNDKRSLKWKQFAVDILLKYCLPQIKGKRETFLMGDSGPLALWLVCCPEQLEKDKHYGRAWAVDCLLKLAKFATNSSDMEDELLYGRCGVLYALLFARKRCSTACTEVERIQPKIIHSLTQTILDSGHNLAHQVCYSKQAHPSPMMYEWHGKAYMGAAHGLVGILHTLLLTCEELGDEKMFASFEPFILWLLDYQFDSGNFPSSLGNVDDRLVQWCHGAPGWISTLLLAASSSWSSTNIRNACSNTCQKAVQVVWQRGLLQKGYGLCHGVGGNGYSFLMHYRYTASSQDLHRAARFGQWCAAANSHGCRGGDRPFSLFEGLAGAALFLAELLAMSESHSHSPRHQACFPGFEI